jgi:hypothetical protein
MIKRSDLIDVIKDLITDANGFPQYCDSSVILETIEKYLEPKKRSPTLAEVEEHPLVKQAHETRKDDIRLYVANLDYEKKRAYLPE